MGHQRVSRIASSSDGVDRRGLMCPFSQEKVVEMHWDILIPNYQDPKTITLVRENVERISSGSSSYCAVTLKVGLKKAFEFKKKKRLPLKPHRAFVRCSNPSCSYHTSSMSCSPSITVFHCPYCKSSGLGSYCFQCTSCGHDRTGNYMSCQNCGGSFC